MNPLVTITLDGQQVIAAIIAAAAVAGALALFARWILRAVRVLFALADLAERELTHNHGSSMKDDTTGNAVAIGKLQRQFDDHLKTHHTWRTP